MAFETKRSGPCEPPRSCPATDRKAGVSCTLSTILSHAQRLALGEPETDVVPVRTTPSSSLLRKYLTTHLISASLGRCVVSSGDVRVPLQFRSGLGPVQPM